ncbi:MAG: hypothetical protein JW839_07170 [Candidatus Lokiarchaeota archaeon]|nr:hypothetical protein [Candidatus Lokiarchaeota archaeon]
MTGIRPSKTRADDSPAGTRVSPRAATVKHETASPRCVRLPNVTSTQPVFLPE